MQGRQSGSFLPLMEAPPPGLVSFRQGGEGRCSAGAIKHRKGRTVAGAPSGQVGR